VLKAQKLPTFHVMSVHPYPQGRIIKEDDDTSPTTATPHASYLEEVKARATSDPIRVVSSFENYHQMVKDGGASVWDGKPNPHMPEKPGGMWSTSNIVVVTMYSQVLFLKPSMLSVPACAHMTNPLLKVSSMIAR
jgi:hypothetical protein